MAIYKRAIAGHSKALQHLTLEEQSVSYVIFNESLHHMPHAPRALAAGGPRAEIERQNIFVRAVQV